MGQKGKQSVALVWAQFAAYHVDRCEAVARRLQDRCDVLAIEVATTSVDYAWEPSGDVAGASKITLFPGRSFDAVRPFTRFVAMLRATRHADVVCLGLSYAIPDAILLSWTLRLLGKRVVVFSESKFDDTQRSIGLERLKSIALSCYTAAIVGGRRHADYFRFLGFRRRPVLPGYDGVGLERIRTQGGKVLAPAGAPHGERPFVFVGRFVDKKNLVRLVEGYARYVTEASSAPHRLVLVGAGAELAAITDVARALDVSHLIDLPGFLGAEAVSRQLAGALALVLVSGEEQWGLVVNEALAFGLPVIVSNEVGSRDALVRNLVNGFVVESNSPEGIGRAMLALASDPALWERMVSASHQRAWLGDVERLADAMEVLLDPANQAAAGRLEQFSAELELTRR